MRNPRVSIIILNWKTPQLTFHCLRSLKNIIYKNYKIIIINNGEYITHSSLKKTNKRVIKVIENSSNNGFCKGVNQGIKYCFKISDYILLLNNDTEVSKNFLSTLVQALKKDKSVGIAGSLIFYLNKKLIWFGGGKIDFNNGPFVNIDQGQRNSSIFKSTNTDFVSGCCMLIKKDVIQKIGLFDEEYQSYVEDIAYCLKASNAGYKILFVPESKIYHAVSSNTGGEVNPTKQYLISRNLCVFAAKTLKNNTRIKFLFLILKTQLTKLIYYLKNDNIAISLAILKGFTAGIIKFIVFLLITVASPH